MAAENRTAGPLAALAPGEAVVIEIGGDVRRPRDPAGTVARLEGPPVVVSCRSPRGVPYVQRYGQT